jgi:hypothetical protein
MTERGATHLKAVCVVAARLAERAWLTLSRGEPYTICDLDGRPVTATQARDLIEQRQPTRLHAGRHISLLAPAAMNHPSRARTPC